MKPATRADDDKLMSALQRLCDEDPSLYGHPGRRDAPDDPRGERRGASRGDARAAGPQVQRARRARGAAHPLPRDDHPGRAQAEGQAQEAVRRTRAVRRVPPAPRAAAARRGLRVPRRGRGRRHPAPVHPGRGEGRDGDVRRGRALRLPGRGRVGDGRRRQGALGRLERGQLQDGGGAGHPGGDGGGGADRARADLAARR